MASVLRQSLSGRLAPSTLTRAPLVRREITRPAAGLPVSLEQVEKSFGDRRVLSSIDFSARPGEFVAVIGRSGSGKSTLLRLLAGLETADGGSVRLDNEVPKRAAAHVRIMFQDGRLLPWRRVLANVALGLQPAERGRAQEALALVGLADRGSEWPLVLSGGQKQRVALARALAAEPRLLLLDEPLGALDALTRLEMQRLIERLWQRAGFTAVLVTHDVAEAVMLADRIVLIEEGRIALDVPVDLPRPRGPGAAFSAIEARILDRLLQGT